LGLINSRKTIKNVTHTIQVRYQHRKIGIEIISDHKILKKLRQIWSYFYASNIYFMIINVML